MNQRFDIITLLITDYRLRLTLLSRRDLVGSILAYKAINPGFNIQARHPKQNEKEINISFSVEEL